MEIDPLDHKIITHLAEDARMPLAQIAKDLGVATATIHQRVKRMREKGIIRGARIVLDWEAVGLPVVALISISVPSAGSLAKVAQELSAIPYIQNCFAVTGEFDLLLVVRTRSSAHLGDVLEAIRGVSPGSSRTVVVLSTYFEGRIPPLDDAS